MDRGPFEGMRPWWGEWGDGACPPLLAAGRGAQWWAQTLRKQALFSTAESGENAAANTHGRTARSTRADITRSANASCGSWFGAHAQVEGARSQTGLSSRGAQSKSLLQLGTRRRWQRRSARGDRGARSHGVVRRVRRDRPGDAAVGCGHTRSAQVRVRDLLVVVAIRGVGAAAVPAAVVRLHVRSARRQRCRAGGRRAARPARGGAAQRSIPIVAALRHPDARAPDCPARTFACSAREAAGSA
jgi:hypothetical protein